MRGKCQWASRQENTTYDGTSDLVSEVSANTKGQNFTQYFGNVGYLSQKRGWIFCLRISRFSSVSLSSVGVKVNLSLNLRQFRDATQRSFVVTEVPGKPIRPILKGQAEKCQEHLGMQ